MFLFVTFVKEEGAFSSDILIEEETIEVGKFEMQRQVLPSL